MKKWLFNPFVYVAGAKSLIAGWAIMAVTACICYYSKTHFDGVLGVKRRDGAAPIARYFLEAMTDWGCITLMLYFAGRMFSKSSIRLIDVAGTQALARWPMLLASVIGFAIVIPAGLDTMPPKDVVNAITPSIILFSLLEVVIVIWMVALMYNAFIVSCNVKGGKATGIFIGALLIAQIISSIFLHLIYNRLI